MELQSEYQLVSIAYWEDTSSPALVNFQPDFQPPSYTQQFAHLLHSISSHNFRILLSPPLDNFELPVALLSRSLNHFFIFEH